MKEIGKTVLDVGCGPSKTQGAYGIDIYPFPGVDQVMDLNISPWNLPENSFEEVYARHVIEHIASIPAFMNETHRVCKNGAIVHIVTPHFSSSQSYNDPTHIWHLGCEWHKIMTHSYLQTQVPTFNHVKTKIVFGSSTFRLITQLIIKLKGVEWWEKKLAFVLRGRNIETTLQVVKA